MKRDLQQWKFAVIILSPPPTTIRNSPTGSRRKLLEKQILCIIWDLLNTY